MIPTFVVDARGQLGHVIGGSVALDVGDLAEVVDGMGGVRRATADAKDEESSAICTKPDQSLYHLSDLSLREFGADSFRLVQIGLYVLAKFRFHFTAPSKINSTAFARFATRQVAGAP